MQRTLYFTFGGTGADAATRCAPSARRARTLTGGIVNNSSSVSGVLQTKWLRRTVICVLVKKHRLCCDGSRCFSIAMELCGKTNLEVKAAPHPDLFNAEQPPLNQKETRVAHIRHERFPKLSFFLTQTLLHHTSCRQTLNFELGTKTRARSVYSSNIVMSWVLHSLDACLWFS